MSNVAPKVTRRLIGEHDLDAIVDLLADGFPAKSRDCWRRGLDRQRARSCPPDAPQFGVILESERQIVGIVLSIFSGPSDSDSPKRCNFSSWYVKAGFEAYALLLTNFLLHDRSVTFFNLSPAPHTVPIIEAQGFKPYDRGWFLTLPAVRLGGSDARVTRCSGDENELRLTDAERAVLRDHHAMGCLCFVVRSGGKDYPFVFSTRRRLGWLPASFLIYCRNIDNYAMFAGNLGRALLRHAIVAVILDQRCETLLAPGRLISRHTVKYYRGPDAPRPGDHSYSELAVFDA